MNNVFKKLLDIPLALTLFFLSSVTTSSSAALLFSDDFDGPLNSSPNASAWTISGSPLLDGGSNVNLFSGDKLASIDTFGPGVVIEIDMASYGGGNGAFGLVDVAGDFIQFSTSNRSVLMIKSGGSSETSASNLYTDANLDGAVLRIDWTPTKIEFFIDNISIYSTTDTSVIPTNPTLSARLTRNSGVATIDSVTVSNFPIPEPASLGLLGLGGIFISLRRGKLRTSDC